MQILCKGFIANQRFARANCRTWVTTIRPNQTAVLAALKLKKPSPDPQMQLL